MSVGEPDSPFVAVLCPVCGSENEINPDLERFSCFQCGKRSFTKAAIAFKNESEAQEAQKAETYKQANRMMLGLTPGGLERAAELFESLGSWKDSAAQAEECRLRMWDYRFIDKHF